MTEKTAAITTAEEAVEYGKEVEATSLTRLAEENATLRNRRKNQGKGKKPNGQKSTTAGEPT